jgi:hypothetical protein
MTPRNFIAGLGLTLLAFLAASCATTTSGNLTTGMTPDQTVQAMGQPDLKDNIPDPSHSGASVLRYVWLEPGKAAIFGSDERLASVQTVETDTKQKVEEEMTAKNTQPTAFDPLNTPLNYMFFPIKAGFIYLGAGANCLGGGACQKPHLPPPSAS